MKSITFFFLAAAPLAADIEIYPTLHFNGVLSETSADSFDDIGGHGHDPNDEYAIQGIDVGLNVKIDDWFASFINVNTFTTPDHELEAELEEAFGKFMLPGGFEIRGGQFLNRIGLQNNRHLHAWKFVNSNLSTSQFLGEEGLTTEGFDVSWSKDFNQTFFAFTASYGKASEHEEEEEEEGGEEEHNESVESAYFNHELVTARARLGYNQSDFHQHQIGLNGAWGDNGFGRDTSLYSIDYTYTWRENGLEPGGRSFSAGAEYFTRNVEWIHPENSANQGDSNQFSWMVFAQYRFAENWVADFRYEHLEGVNAGPELDGGEIEYAIDFAERDRFSLALTHEFQLSDIDSLVRLQYQHDDLEEGSEDSIFLQFGFSFGQDEVR